MPNSKRYGKSSAAISGHLHGQSRDNIGSLTEEIVANIKSVLLTIFCAAGAVLLVGCVNLAGISLSRAAARQRELAVRTALGGPEVN